MLRNHPKTLAMSTLQQLKFFRPIRVLATPAMKCHYKMRDKAYAKSVDSIRVRSMKDSYKGERCFIVGNGPSLNERDLDALIGEITFASNGIYHIFDKTCWRPTYYFCVDQTFLALESNEVMSVDAKQLFLDIQAKHYARYDDDRITFINWHRARYSSKKFTTDAIEFSRHPEQYICSGHTVTYAIMQMALYMGFSELYLIGIDHTYGKSAYSNGDIKTTGVAQTHFFDDGRTGGYYYFDGVEFAYSLANAEAQARGSVIYNATRGGNLELFERVNLDQVLNTSNH